MTLKNVPFQRGQESLSGNCHYIGNLGRRPCVDSKRLKTVLLIRACFTMTDEGASSSRQPKKKTPACSAEHKAGGLIVARSLTWYYFRATTDQQRNKQIKKFHQYIQASKKQSKWYLQLESFQCIDNVCRYHTKASKKLAVARVCQWHDIEQAVNIYAKNLHQLHRWPALIVLTHPVSTEMKW